MRKILPIGLIAIMPLLSAAQNNPFINAGSYNPPTDSTVIPGGNVSGEWTAENNPYIVSGDITVAAGDTLIIGLGAVVQFGGGCDFIVNGVLHISGSPSQRVTMSRSSIGTTFLDYRNSQGMCYIRYADISGFYEIKLGSNPVRFSYSSFVSHIKAYSLSTGTIIEYCSLSYSSTGGWTYSINGGGGSNWLVMSNSIYEFHSASTEMFDAGSTGIGDVNGTVMENNITAIAYNPIGHSYAYGISDCSGDISHNIIFISSSPDGENIGIADCSGIIHHNTIIGNGGFTYCQRAGLINISGSIYNNVADNTVRGVQDCSGTVQNSIIINCDVGLEGFFTSQYNCIYNCDIPYSGVTPGMGDILVNPQLAGYYLSPISPCIDAGNPDPFYTDPDGTRDDMGANWFDQSGFYPENLYIQMAGNDVVLEWSADVFADAYRVYRSDNPYSFGTQYLAEVTNTTFTDMGAMGENYYYKVVSVHW